MSVKQLFIILSLLLPAMLAVACNSSVPPAQTENEVAAGEHNTEASDHHEETDDHHADETDEHHAEGMDHEHAEAPANYQDMTNPPGR